MLHRPSRARAALARLALVAATTLLPALAGAAEVIVFGGTGKLGSEVVRALNAAGHEVTVFHREGSDRSRLQGLKYREAAEVLGVPEGTVKSRVHDGLNRMREWFASHEPKHPPA